jgi:BirA family biotin operon repressor/biotin-[acetyl-CoA-carboxylase] ligase
MDVIRLATTPSTQDVARTLPVGSMVLADHQSAGRGRLGRTWEAPAGTALLASFVMPFNPLASLAAGVAAAEACGPDVRLKWPNDLLLDRRKVGGILVEVAERRAVVGIGINLTASPPGAAVLGDEREALLERLVPALERWFAAPPEAVLSGWRARSDTLGRRVRAAVAGQIIEGLAEDIDADGALVVDGRRVRVGDVSYLRPVQEDGEESRPTSP